jgi:hypothetical protein
MCFKLEKRESDDRVSYYYRSAGEEGRGLAYKKGHLIVNVTNRDR